LSIWTVFTAFLDLTVAYGLLMDFSGEPIFLVIFSIPFNAVFVMLWSLVAVKFFGPKKPGPWFGTGIRILDEGNEVRFRLPRVPPIWAAFFAAFVVPIVTSLPMGMLTLGRPSVPVATVALILVLVSILLTYVIVARRIAMGKTDLVVDRLAGTFTLPQSFGRGEPVTISCAHLGEIRVVKEEKTDSEGCVTMIYAVAAQWRAANGGMQEGRLAEFSIAEAAEELARAIRRIIPGTRCT
jgi:hypothetical protein